MQLPLPLINSLEGVKGFDKDAFLNVHQSGEQITSIRINPLKWSEAEMLNHTPLNGGDKVPWSRHGYYLTQRPSFTFDPLFHAGCYYVQEASSQFLEQALMQTVDLSQSLTVLDLCAAPGGKSTHIQSLISADSLLVSNDVIKSRSSILKQNIIKWGCNNVVVTNNDPKHFARLENFFDVVVIDAPCSGSGLFRRDEEAIAEWSEDAVQLCCGRQKRIISDAFDSVKEGGILIYSTCSYSKAEDEDISDWLVKEMNMENIQLHIEADWGVIETASEITGAVGYRFFPDKVKGEGFYLSVFKKTSSTEKVKLKSARLEKSTKGEVAIVQKWIGNKPVELLKAYYIYAVPSSLVDRYAFVKQYLNIQYAGTAIGEVMKDKLVPEHALALSPLLSPSIPTTDVDFDTAILYLQRGEGNINTESKGWMVVTYKGHHLGWINALQNRINNYYPKEFRILKRRDESAFEK